MRPLLKWAGGKAWLVKNHSHLLPRPTPGNHYIEPFVGGGSVAGFYLERTPEEAGMELLPVPRRP